jgi:chemotaxis protein CheD
MNNFQFPYIDDSRKSTARYGNIAISLLIKMMIAEGSSIAHLEAHILGGAFYPEISRENIGSENISIAKKILSGKGIRVVSEDVGGSMGRKVVYNTNTNELIVIKVDQVRQGDWYPYENRD